MKVFKWVYLLWKNGHSVYYYDVRFMYVLAVCKTSKITKAKKILFCKSLKYKKPFRNFFN